MIIPIRWSLTLPVDHIRQLKAGKTVPQPIYSYLTCTRDGETIPVQSREVIISVLLNTIETMLNL